MLLSGVLGRGSLGKFELAKITEVEEEGERVLEPTRGDDNMIGWGH
jgi:hypothetical protein